MDNARSVPTAKISIGWQRFGCVMAALSVAGGAFGAHALRDTLSSEALGWWHTGHEYHVFGSFSILVAASLLRHQSRQRTTALSVLAAGTLIFSISLYALALSGWRILGAITPIGGALLILGWLMVAWACKDPD